jgi:hypothetical protein
VWIPDEELHAFDRPPHLEPARNAARFPGTHDGPVGEATPAYLYLGEAITGLARAVPGIVGMVILQEPVAWADSHY